MAFDHTHVLLGPDMEAHLTDNVQGILLSCHPPTVRELQGDVVNHWRFHLLTDLGNPGASVVLDMVKTSGTDTTGIMGVVHKPYAASERMVQGVGIEPTKRFTVSAVIEWLDKGGYLRYKYADTAVGCRYWAQAVVSGLGADGLVTDDSVTGVQNTIGYLWRPGQGVKADPVGEKKDITPGTFY